jgi:hypothetical protein
LIKAGETFPDLPLAVPLTAWDRNYLGITATPSFTLKQIKAEVILVEMLSVYCPACQRQTTFFNNLFKEIEGSHGLKDRVKIVGIAAGNGQLEIEDFKKQFNVRFPILPDPQFKMHSAIGSSRTPFTIIVRQNENGMPGVVGYTHLGPLENVNQLMLAIDNIMQMDIAAVSNLATQQKQISTRIAPLYTGEELRSRIEAAFQRIGGPIRDVQKVHLPETSHLYSCIATIKGASQRLFANVIARPPACSDCHDIHFIYVFDSSGKILDIVNLQLTKWGNEPWDAADMAKLRERLVGKSLRSPLIFNPAIDAVSSATITSAMIFDSLSQGNHLLKTLQAKGWL